MDLRDFGFNFNCHLNIGCEMTNRKNTQSDHTLHVGDWLHIALANWKWFVLSLVVCMGASFWYIKRSPDIYSRSASVLIKDETRGAQLPNAASAFSEMDLLNIQSTVDNEVLIFKSKRLMIEVARKLKLDIFYSVKGKFRDWDLYTTSPVTLTFPEALETSSFSFKVTPLNDKEVLLSDFPEMEGVKPVEQMKVHLNDTVATPVGKLVVTPTLYYTQDYYQVPVTVNKMNLEKVGMAYNAALQSMVASKTSSIIHLSISDVSPRRAEDILNTLIDVYNQDAIDDKNRIAVNTANFINERLIVIEQELGGVESQIADYKSQHNLADISTQTGSFMERSNRYQQEGVTLENQRTLALYIRDYLADPAKSGELIPSNTGISDGTIERQIMEYNELMLQRDKLIGNSSNKNPVVMDMNNSLASMKQTIVRTVDNLIAGLDMKIQNIRGEEERAMKRIAAVPSQQKYVLSVERQQKIKESLYIYLLNKREENALTKSITESNARIIDPAMGSSVPVSPKTHLIMLAGFMLGLLLPACVLFVLRTSDTKVRGKKDLTDVLSVPFLGEIPRREREKGEGNRLVVVTEEGKDAVSEAFRILRTNMAFMSGAADGKLQTLMVTSFHVGDGKTFVSSNLAMTLALAGYKVVLVDLDIRKGTLSKHMGGSQQVGVTNFLAGTVDRVDDLLMPSGCHENLSLVCKGPVPPNPSELLLNARLNVLIRHLKERFDYVILDNVPSHMVADALIVNRVADLTLYVIRAGGMDRRQLPEIELLHTEHKLKNMALVLNGVSRQRDSYGYYGYYQYGYKEEK